MTMRVGSRDAPVAASLKAAVAGVCHEQEKAGEVAWFWIAEIQWLDLIREVVKNARKDPRVHSRRKNA